MCDCCIIIMLHIPTPYILETKKKRGVRKEVKKKNLICCCISKYSDYKWSLGTVRVITRNSEIIQAIIYIYMCVQDPVSSIRRLSAVMVMMVIYYV